MGDIFPLQKRFSNYASLLKSDVSNATKKQLFFNYHVVILFEFIIGIKKNTDITFY